MSFFAQTNDLYTYDYDNLTADETTFMGFALGTLFLGALIFWVISIIALWKVFEKAGQKGWKAIIPFYNYWVLCEIAGRPGWWSLSILLAIIPFVGWIVPLIVYIFVALDLGKAFGKSTVFSVIALIIFSFIGLIILGFGKDQYKKPPAHTAATP
jgi:hypothetical protein